ncbi:MAG: sodium:calcium antiporter, partial [Acidimicrobiales bacterium]
MLVAAVYLVIVTVLQAPWWAGFIGLLVFTAGLVYTLARPRSEDFPIAVEAEAVVGGTSTLSLSRLVIYSIGALCGTLACAELFLIGALRLADSFGLSQGVTGGILVSIGTSLPEIATSIQAARKGMAGMVAGNVIGSSFFNLAGVGSVALLLGGDGSIGG